MYRPRLARLAVIVLAAVVAAGAAAENGRSALFFLFEPTRAEPGNVVTVRTGGTPASFALRQRVKPFQRPIRLYLVPNGLALNVHSRFDARAHFVGSLVPDARGRGLLRFTVPPIESDGYTVGAWCPECAPYSRGQTWSVIHVTEQNIVARYRPLMLLRVTAPPASETCPATLPNGNLPPGYRTDTWGFHGNGALWAALPRGGVFEFRPDRVAPDGSTGTKQIWWAAGTPSWADLIVRIQRLDVPGSLLAAQTVRGWPQRSGFRGSGSWAARLSFPSEGCWKITGRVQDIRLSFVVRVVTK